MEKGKDIEQIIKKQFCKIFKQNDWYSFKLMADYYFKAAAEILKKDVEIDESYKLMARNIQKRLFIGIGGELLLKSLFLKNDFCINKVLEKERKKDKALADIKKPLKSDKSPKDTFLNPCDTYSFNQLIESLSDVMKFSDESKVKKGLKIAKVFRNKEGHAVLLWHEADRQNYTDIESSIKSIYKEGFEENLEFKISFLKNETAMFSKS
ncbi:MAG: hypothetical protein LUM44_01720 [Pyrinomonadaceae bacterium]|nr:hypothetical protein [Pyrinomonadaceae bacterium]